MLLNHATINGVSFFFDAPYPVGTFDTDSDDIHMFVVNTDGISIISDSPASEPIDGYMANGVMANPYLFTGEVAHDSQGWDAMIASGAASYISPANTAYSADRNVSPTATGAPLVLLAGQEVTFTKSVRLANATRDSWSVIDRYIHLHVLSESPPADAYPPSPSATVKTIYRRSSINWNALHSLTLPASFSYTAAGALANTKSELGLWGDSNSSCRRRFRIDNSSSNYSADLSEGYARPLYKLHDATLSPEDRQLIADKVIRWGIHCYGLYQRDAATNNANNSFGGGAGQGGCVAQWLYYAGALLNDADIWAAAKAHRPQQTTNLYWLDADDIGRAAPGKSGVYAQTAFTEHVGMPYVIPDEWGANLDTRYGVIAAKLISQEALAIAAIADSPTGETGAQAMLLGGTLSPTNPRAALLAWLTTYRTWNPWYFGARAKTVQWDDLYDLIYPLTGNPAYTTRPLQIHTSGPNFAALDGGVSWNLTTHDFSTETITRTDFRYSLDGVQFIEELDVAINGSKTGLLHGATHWLGMRQVSASGAGPWSVNHPRNWPTVEVPVPPDRNTLTPTGTVAETAPVNTLPPVIHARIYPNWWYKVWKPVSGLLTADDINLAAGDGYWSGFPAPSFTYQWKRNGDAIAGASSKSYSRVAADAEAVITCDVTATNASGSSTVTTASVTAPALIIPPAETLIETDFRGGFLIDYEYEWNSRAGTGAYFAHLPEENFSTYTSLYPTNLNEGADTPDYGINIGALKSVKTSAWGRSTFVLQRQLVAGRTYRCQAQVVLPTVANDFIFSLRKPLTSGVHVGASHSSTTPAPLVSNIDFNFTVGSAETDLGVQVRLEIGTATGGTSGGNPHLTYLKISEVEP
jgi:hypothetical protein